MAQANLNNVVMAGRLASDVEARDVGDKRVAKFRFVTNRSYKVEEEWKTVPTFIGCEAWGPLAERVEKLAKGEPVFLTARLDLDEWQDNDGNKRSAHKLTLNTIQSLSGGNSGESQQEDSPPARRTSKGKGGGKKDDDLPF